MEERENSSVCESIAELAEPKVTGSAQIENPDTDALRISEQPSATVLGTVSEIIAPHAGQPEKAQIAMEGIDNQDLSLRIENALTDVDGVGVGLKEGEHVRITVTAK